MRVDLPERAGWRITAATPPVGVVFWAMAVCVGTVGAYAGSTLLLLPGFGRVSAVVAAVAWFGASVAFQLRARRGLTWWYWVTTLLAGVAVRAVTGVLVNVPAAVLLGVVLWGASVVWWHVERSPGLAGLRRSRWQLFFWLTLVVAVALGDVLGRLLAGYGLVLAAGAGIAALVLLPRPRRAAMTVAFWATYVLLQPFGSGMESWFARSRRSGGLGVGTADTIEFFVLSALSLMAYQAGTRPTESAPSRRDPAGPRGMPDRIP